jgi:hypothetical protein
METTDRDRPEEQGEDGDSDIEVVEEGPVEEEEGEDDAVINIPLSISFFLGGLGFLLVFVVSTISGTHVIIGLLWSSLTFVSLSIVGYLTDALIEFPGIAPMEIVSEEDDAGLITDLDDEPAVEAEPGESDEELTETEVEVGIETGQNDVDQGSRESETTPTI